MGLHWERHRFLLADGVARLSRGSTIDRAAASPSQVLRHVRRHPQVPAFPHKIRGVETFVASSLLVRIESWL